MTLETGEARTLLRPSAKGGLGNAEMIAECQWPVSGSRSESAEIQNLICTDRRYGIDYSISECMHYKTGETSIVADFVLERPN